MNKPPQLTARQAAVALQAIAEQGIGGDTGTIRQAILDVAQQCERLQLTYPRIRRKPLPVAE